MDSNNFWHGSFGPNPWERYTDNDEGFNNFLYDLSGRLSLLYDGTADNWYLWLKHDPDYDYRAFYDNEKDSRLMATYGDVNLPIKYAKQPGITARYYTPDMRYRIGDGRIAEIIDPYEDVDNSLSYLNKNIPGKIAYRKDEALQKTLKDLKGSNRYDIINRCKNIAIKNGFTLRLAAALLGNGFLESSFTVLNNIYLMSKELYNEYSKWLNGQPNTPEKLTEFVVKALTRLLGDSSKAYGYMNTPYSNVSLSIRDLHDTDIDAYNKQYGNTYFSAFSNPMTLNITNELAFDWFNGGSLNDMTAAITLLFEKPKLDEEHHYGAYNNRMNYANALYDLFVADDRTMHPTRDDIQKRPLLLEILKLAYKTGGALPKRISSILRYGIGGAAIKGLRQVITKAAPLMPLRWRDYLRRANLFGEIRPSVAKRVKFTEPVNVPITDPITGVTSYQRMSPGGITIRYDADNNVALEKALNRRADKLVKAIKTMRDYFNSDVRRLANERVYNEAKAMGYDPLYILSTDALHMGPYDISIRPLEAGTGGSYEKYGALVPRGMNYIDIAPNRLLLTYFGGLHEGFHSGRIGDEDVTIRKLRRKLPSWDEQMAARKQLHDYYNDKLARVFNQMDKVDVGDDGVLDVDKLVDRIYTTDPAEVGAYALLMGQEQMLDFGQAYPGDDAVKLIMDELRLEHIGDHERRLLDAVLDTPEARRNFWDLLTGQYYMLPIALATGAALTAPFINWSLY